MEGLLATFGQPGVSLERVSRCFKLLKVVETTVGLQVFSDHFGLRFFQVSNFVPNFLLWTFSSVGKFRKFRKASKKCNFLSTKAIWRTFKQLSETFTSKKNIKTKIYISTDSPSLSSQKKKSPLKVVFHQKKHILLGPFLGKGFRCWLSSSLPKIPETEGQRSLDKWVSLPVSVHGNELDAVWLPKHHHSRFERLHLQVFGENFQCTGNCIF